jgi:2-keto-3-deoxy-L-rhamnonate aldolase RhmA
MQSKILLAALGAALLAGTSGAFAQAYVPPGVDPAQKWPLAAKAGVDSHAEAAAPAGAVNKGAFNDKTWVRSKIADAPPDHPIWNPAKLKMMQGGMLTSVTIPADSNPQTYCEGANSGVDYIWTEMQHSDGTWQEVHNMWSACPHAKAVPGMRVPNANEFDEQHAMDQGALVIVVPTVRSVEEGKEAVKWAYYPPLGGRSNGGGSATLPTFWGQVPGGYRNTINDNLVLILMIETLDGLKDADKIAKLPGVTGIFAASGDLGNFGGYKQGDPDYEREINIVHDAAIKAHVRLCGPYNWVGRPDFTCFQGPGGSEAGDLVGAEGHLPKDFVEANKKALGALYNTQGKVTVGPFSPGWVPPKPQPRAGG